MRKTTYSLTLLFSLTASTFLLGQDGQGQNGQGQNGQGQNGQGQVVRVPEPSAIPELLVSVAGLSFVAWRRRKQFC